MRRPVLARRAVAGALLPVLLAALVACGGDKDPVPTAEEVASESASADPSADESTSEPAESTVEPSGEGEPDGRSIDKAAFVDELRAATEKYSSAHTTVRMDIAGQRMNAEGDMDYGSGKPTMRMTMRLPSMSGRMELRMVDGVMFMSMPPMTPRGKFLKIDPKDPNNPLGGQFDDLSRQMDPRRSFDAFEAGLREVRYVGEDSIGGETVDHYTLTLDAAAVAEEQGMQMPSGAPETIDYELWLDSEKRMRRVTFDLTGQGQMEMTMSDWGKPVRVTAPRPNQIMEMPRRAS